MNPIAPEFTATSKAFDTMLWIIALNRCQQVTVEKLTVDLTILSPSLILHSGRLQAVECEVALRDRTDIGK